jgi:predicted N-acetyltransferase YhbS
MIIEYLADHMQFASTLAEWHYEEWKSLIPHWSREEAEAELRSHVNRLAIPTTFVALDNDHLVGSASLLASDLEGFEHLTPWLASVYVAPTYRGLGTGQMLVLRAVEDAERMACSSIYLWTAGQERFYRRLGWEEFQRIERHERELTIMRLRA